MDPLELSNITDIGIVTRALTEAEEALTQAEAQRDAAIKRLRVLQEEIMTALHNTKGVEERRSKILLGDISDFTPHVVSCLGDAGITTLGDLTSKTELDVQNVNGLGPNGFTTIKKGLMNLGLTLSSPKNGK